MSSRSMTVKVRGSALPTFACLLLAAVLAGQASATVITPSPVSISAVEGSSFNGSVASFTDDNVSAVPSGFTATINWGDGSATAGTTVQPGGIGTAFIVQGTHTYVDEGVFAVSVVIFDAPPGTGTATATSTATVAEGDALLGAPVTFSAPVGVSFTGNVATFTDTLTSAVSFDFTATINWGDSTTSAGAISGGGGTFGVSGTHTYAGTGTYTVVVTMTDDAPGTATAQVTSTAHISSGLAVTAISFSTPEGAAWNGIVATFSDADTSKTPISFTATVGWGDGTTSAATVIGGSGSFSLTGSHTYADEGTYTVTVTVNETGPGGATANGPATATVTEADVLLGTPVTFSPTAAFQFSGVVATFTDAYAANVPSDFVATINWGDGSTTPGTVAGGGGAFTVSGIHTYTSPGNNTVTVTLSDDAPGTATASVTSTANVAAPSGIPAVGGFGLAALGLVIAAAGIALLRKL
jgi:PKD repeat protein